MESPAQTPGHAQQVAHKRKLDKSWEGLHQEGICLIPIATKSLGVWHKSAVREVNKLAYMFGDTSTILQKHT